MLLTAKELEAGLRDIILSPWCASSLAQLNETVGSPDFPCLFGKRAQRLQTWQFSFVDSVTTPAGRREAMADLIEYLSDVMSAPRTERAFCPLLIVVRPEEPPLRLEQYHKQAWDWLQFLHDNDEHPWPSHIPTDPDSRDWVFCFRSTPIFVNFSTPAADGPRHRRLCSSLVFVLQPEDNIQFVTRDDWSGPTGTSIRSLIRKRLIKYSGHDLPPEFADLGTDKERIWKQMYIPDPRTGYPAQCPFQCRHG